MDEFEVQKTTRFVLIKDGQPIVDAHGQTRLYDSREEAEFVAVAWDLHRAPTYAELQDMSDDELRTRLVGVL